MDDEDGPKSIKDTEKHAAKWRAGIAAFYAPVRRQKVAANINGSKNKRHEKQNFILTFIHHFLLTHFRLIHQIEAPNPCDIRKHQHSKIDRRPIEI